MGKHLTLDDRIRIQAMLGEGKSVKSNFREIAKSRINGQARGT